MTSPQRKPKTRATAAEFDRKFGPGRLAEAPLSPGVYVFYDEGGNALYVGKAKRLRRRLSQYRNATRAKKDKRMRRVVAEAARLEWQGKATHLDALLDETRLIQALKPRLNIANAFPESYRFVGLAEDSRLLTLCLTRHPEKHEGFAFHGAFRSRAVTGAAFFALARLLEGVAHREPRRKGRGAAAPTPGSWQRAFRRVPPELAAGLSDFLAGTSPGFLGDLAWRLLDSPDARARAAAIEEDLALLKLFWEQEAAALRRVIAATGYEAYPVPRTERDPLFIRYREAHHNTQKNPQLGHA